MHKKQEKVFFEQSVFLKTSPNVINHLQQGYLVVKLSMYQCHLYLTSFITLNTDLNEGQRNYKIMEIQARDHYRAARLNSAASFIIYHLI